MKVFGNELIEEACAAASVSDLATATIGEVLLVAKYLEEMKIRLQTQNSLEVTKMEYYI